MVMGVWKALGPRVHGGRGCLSVPIPKLSWPRHLPKVPGPAHTLALQPSTAMGDLGRCLWGQHLCH